MDELDMEGIWEEALSLFLRQSTVDSPNKEHLIRTLIYSLDHYPHLIGIDGSDVINLFKGSKNFKILYEEFSEKERMISLEEVRPSLSAHSPVYVHFEANYSMNEECYVFSLFELNDILSFWLDQDPSREILFSLVQSPSPDGLLKLWQIFPS